MLSHPEIYRLRCESRCGVGEGPGSLFLVMWRAFASPSFRVVTLYRVGKMLHESGWALAARLVHRHMVMRHGVDINVGASIGVGLRMPHPVAIVIGGKVRIGRGVHVAQGVTIGGAGGKRRSDGSTQPIIGDGVLIGAGAKVVGPVTVGDRATIGANAVVVSDVPCDAIAVGVPARTVVVREPSKDVTWQECNRRLEELESAVRALRLLLKRECLTSDRTEAGEQSTPLGG